MATFTKYNCFVADLGLKKHNLNSDVLKVMLTLTAPVATNAVIADLTEIASGNGYTTGGTAMGSTSYAQVSGVAKLAGANVVYTATGGSIANFRYATLYNSTAAGGPLIGSWDSGATQTVTVGNTFTVIPSDVTDILDLT